MKRRSLLASVVAGTVGIAGCGEVGDGSDRGNLDVPGNGTDGTDDPGGTPGPGLPRGLTRSVNSAFGPERRIHLSALPGEAPPDGTRLTAGFVGTTTADAPPRVWMALTNVSDRERTLTFGPTPPFSGYNGRGFTWGRVGDVGLLLVPADDREYANYDLVIPEEPGNATSRRGGDDEEDGDNRTDDDAGGPDPEKCWRARTVLSNPRRTKELTLAPGESVTGEYLLLYGLAIDYCPPERGGFRFENPTEGFGVVVSTWDPTLETPGPTAFERSVPSLPGFDATVWYHRVDDAAVYTSPERERAATSGGEVTTTFQNFSAETLRVHRDDWGVYRLDGDGWTTVTERRPAAGGRAIPPGGGSRVRVMFGSSRDGPASDEYVVGGLDPGLYAVRHGTTGGIRRDDTGPLRVEDSTESDGTVTYAALVELVDEPGDGDGGDPEEGDG